MSRRCCVQMPVHFLAGFGKSARELLEQAKAYDAGGEKIAAVISRSNEWSIA